MDTQLIASTAQVLGITASLLSSGVFLASSILIIPPLVPLPINESARIFSYVYETGAAVQGSLNGTAILANAVAAYLIPSHRVEHGTALSAVASSLVFTITYMMPGIKRVQQINALDGSKIQGVRRQEVVDLLWAWRGQNWVRVGLTLAAGLLGSYAQYQYLTTRGQRMKTQ